MTEVTLASLAMDFDVRSADPATQKTNELRAASRALEEQTKATSQAVRDHAVSQGLSGTAAGRVEQSLRPVIAAYGQARDALGRFAQEDGKYRLSQDATIKVMLQNARATDALMREQARAAKQVEALTRAYDPLQAEIIKTNRQIEEAIRLQGAEGAAVDGLRGKLTNLQAANTAAGGSFKTLQYAGLNAGRQLADAFTQIGSGQGLGIVLIQQGPQLIDIFSQLKAEGIGFKAALAGIAAEIAPFAAIAAPLAIVAGLLALGVNRALESEAATRRFTGQLALNVDGLNYNAQALSLASRELTHYGLSTKEASAGLAAFVKEGVDPAKLRAFSISAANLAEVLGGDVRKAQEDVSKAFTGGYEAVAKLDGELNFLTASQREHIRAMYDAGNASAAQAEAFDVFSKRVDDAAEKARGPWQESVRELSGAWSDFLDNLANTNAIQGAVSALQGLMNTVSAALGMGSGDRDKADLVPSFMRPSLIGKLADAAGPGALGTFLGGLDSLGRQRGSDAFMRSAVQGVGDIGRAKTSPAEEAAAKAYQDITRALDGQLVATQKINGAERVRLAGVEEVNKAEARGVTNLIQLEDIRKRAEKVEQVKADRDAAAAGRRGQTAAVRGLRADDATQDALDSAARAELVARRGLTSNIEMLAGFRKDEIAHEAAAAKANVDREVGMKKINEAMAPAIKATIDRTAALKVAASDQQLFNEQLARSRAVEDTIAGYTDRQSQSQLALATSLEQAQAIENKAIADRQEREQGRRDFDLFMEWADGKKTEAEVRQVQDAAAAADAGARAVKAQEDRVAIIERDLGLRQSALQNVIEIAQSETDLARSAGQRHEIEARILAAQHDIEVASIKAAILATNDVAKKEEMARKLAAADEAYANEVKAANSAERAFYDIEAALSAAAYAIDSNDWVKATAALFDAFDTFSKKLKTSGATLEGKIGAIAGLAVGVGNMVGGTGGSALSGAGSGAMAGLGLASSLATLGLAIPGPGWALAAGGAILGGLGGLFGGSSAKKKARREAEARRLAEEQQRQDQIASYTSQFEIDTLRASGNEGAAVALERTGELAALAKLSPALVELKKAYYAAADAAEAAAKAAEKSAQVDARRTSIQDEIDKLTLSSAELLAKTRAKERAEAVALDPALGDLIDKLFGLQNAATAAEAATQAAEEAAKAAEDTAAAVKTAYDEQARIADYLADNALAKVTAAYEEQAKAVDALASASAGIVGHFQALSDSLNELANSLSSELGATGQAGYAAARARLVSANVPDTAEAVRAFLEASKATSSTGAAYRQDVAFAQAIARSRAGDALQSGANLSAIIAAQMRGISPTGFATGGSFEVGGSGPPDSKLFNLALSPGEMVDVRRPGSATNDNSEVAALREEIAALRSEMGAMREDTRWTAKVLKRVSPDGDSLQVKVVT